MTYLYYHSWKFNIDLQFNFYVNLSSRYEKSEVEISLINQDVIHWHIASHNDVKYFISESNIYEYLISDCFKRYDNISIKTLENELELTELEPICKIIKL